MRFLHFCIFLLLIAQLSSTTTCVKDSECASYQFCDLGSCEHKMLFPSIDGLEIAAIFVLGIATVICTVAGIGGGVVFFPILMLMFGFKEQEAAPISITMVFFILLLRNLLSFSDRHPMRDRPVINYDIALLFSPGNIIGNIFGMIINTVSPSWLILIFIMILMTINGIITGQKALELRNQTKNQKQNRRINLSQEALIYLDKLKSIRASRNNENSRSVSLSRPLSEQQLNNFPLPILEDRLLNTSKSGETTPKLIMISNKSIVSYVLPIEEDQDRVTNKQIEETMVKLEKILKKESRFMDYEKGALLFLNLVILVLFNLLRGNKNLKSIVGIDYCSVGFWIFQFLYIPFGLLFLFFVIWLLSKENREKQEAGYIFHQSDLKWDKKTCFQLFINGLLVGIISSLLGVGGAIVSAPLLLKLGVEPQEASFTASFMALFSSIASIIQYVISGQIKWDYAAFYGGVCLIGMITGLKGVLVFLKKKNMLYGIVFVLVFMIIIATILNIYSQIKTIITNEESRYFKSYC